MRAWYRRRYGYREPGSAGRALLRALAAAPAGLRVDQLRARLGYRQSPEAVRQMVRWLIRVKGAPIERRHEGHRVRYLMTAERAP